MRRLRSAPLATLPLVLGFIQSSHAATNCVGQVSGMFTTVTGDVFMHATFRNDWLQVCNVTTAWKSVPTDVCKVWVASLTTLRVTQEPLAVRYNDYTSDTSCGSIPSYQEAPAPVYISINPP